MALPEPAHPKLGQTYNIIVTGVGGTGIVTIGGILGMAAHLEGKGVGVIDMAGLAQKGGAVYSHMRIAERPEDIHAIRVAAGGADLVLGGDIVVAGNKKVLSAVKPGTAMVINTSEFLPGDFTRNADFSLPTERSQARHHRRGGPGAHPFHRCLAARHRAVRLLARRQHLHGRLRLSAWRAAAVGRRHRAGDRAERRGGADESSAAFHWGRRAALDRDAVEALAKPKAEDRDENRTLSQSFEETVERRVAFLTAYQNAAYAARYRALVEKVKAAEAEKAPGQCGLAEAVARYLFKLMAYKDEYEVARLYTDGNFLKQVANELGGDNLRFEFHLAPPLLAKPNPATGEPRKISFGPWMMSAFKVLARFKFLRGTPFDIFGYSDERQTERKLVADYEAMLDEILAKLTPDNHPLAVGLAAIPEKIRGFGPVKARHLAAAKADEAALLEQFRSGKPPLLKAAE